MPETESPVQAALNVLGQAIDENTDRSVAAVDAATVALERSADAIHASGQALAGVAGVKTALDALSLRVAALEQGSVPGPGPQPPDPPASILLGIGSGSTSLIDYPKVQPTTAGDWYVDVSRPASGNGRSLATAFRTIPEALNRVRDGETVIVKGGRYPTPTQINRNVSWNEWVRVLAYGDELVILDRAGSNADHAAVRFHDNARRELWHGFIAENGRGLGNSSQAFAVSFARDIVISRSVVRNWHGGVAGFVVHRGTDIVIQDCIITDLGDGVTAHTNAPDGFASTSYDPHPPSRGTRFVRCVSAYAPDDGIDFWRSADGAAIDCVVFRPGYYRNGARAGDGNGVKLGSNPQQFPGVGPNAVRGSLLLGAFRAGATHNSNPGCAFVNNTASQGRWRGFDYGTGAVRSGNVAWGNGDGDDSQNPNFCDPAAFDFSIPRGHARAGQGASTVALELAKRTLPYLTRGELPPTW